MPSSAPGPSERRKVKSFLSSDQRSYCALALDFSSCRAHMVHQVEAINPLITTNYTQTITCQPLHYYQLTTMDRGQATNPRPALLTPPNSSEEGESWGSKEPEMDLSYLYDASPHLVFCYGSTASDVSHSIYRNLAVSHVLPKGRTLRQCIHQDDQARFSEWFAQSASQTDPSSSNPNFNLWCSFTPEDSALQWQSMLWTTSRSHNGSIITLTGMFLPEMTRPPISDCVTGYLSRISESKEVEASPERTELKGRLVDKAPIGLAIADAKGSLLYGNEKFRDMMLLKDQDALDSWTAHAQPGSLPDILLQLARCMRTKEDGVIEFQLDDDRWLALSLRPLLDSLGDVEAMIVVMHDITERKRLQATEIEYHRKREAVLAERERADIARAKAAEELVSLHAELAERTSEIAAMSLVTTVGLVKSDAVGKVLFANPAWYKIHGLAEDQSLDNWHERIVEEDFKLLCGSVMEATTRHEPLRTTYRLKDGKTVQVDSVPQGDSMDSCTGWIAGVTDITIQAEAAASIKRLSSQREDDLRRIAADAEERREMAEKHREATELLVDVTSHEIRNPIQAIKGCSELVIESLISLRDLFRSSTDDICINPRLWQDELDADIEALHAINDAAASQERIAADVLGLAQLNDGLTQLHLATFDVRQCFEVVTRVFKTSCKAVGIKLRLVFDESVDVYAPTGEIEADSARISQIATNLITNAIRFTEKSETKIITVRIRMTSSPEEDASHRLIVAVEDTGPGMNETELDVIRHRFSQTKPMLHATNGGSGLGLFIAKCLCKVHGGHLTVTSLPSHGTTFTFDLSVRIPASPTPSPNKLYRNPDVASSSSLVAMKFRPMRLLVVEDNQVLSKLLEKQLVKSGHRVVLATEGRQALQLIEESLKVQETFDAVVMDIEMPTLDGISATLHLRQLESLSPSRPRLRVIGCSANARKGQVERAMGSGMDGLVAKPYKLPDLLQALAGDPTPALS